MTRRRPMTCAVLLLPAALGPALSAGPAPAAIADPQAAAEPAAEFRGMWVTRFEWPDTDPARAQGRIDEIMDRLVRARFNAVLFQVRGQADTFYPSPEEPWSPLITTNPQGPGWDPLRYAIDAAHARGLEFHAYLNTHVAWQDSENRPPHMASHLFYQHCNGADPDHRDWLLHDEKGRPVPFADDHYVWIAPGVPAAQAYIRRQVLHVVRHYDVDGAHFDRIRTPGPQFSHDPIAVARQSPGAEGNPAGLDFADWTRDQFTRLLCDLYAQIAEIRPQVKVSAAPVGLYRQERYPDYPASFLYGWSKGHQDAQAWLAAGAIDFVVPQIYWDEAPPPPNFSEVLADWLDHAAGRPVVAGLNGGLKRPELARQVQTVRRRGGHGTVVFGTRAFAAGGGFRDRPEGGLYDSPAAVPPLPFKQQPTQGILLGTLTAADTGEPIVDAQVTRAGSDHVALSSGDGLYAFLGVPEGSYTLTVRKRGFAERSVDPVPVTAGRTTRVDLALTPAAPPAAAPGPAATPGPPAACRRRGCPIPYVAAAIVILLAAAALWKRRKRNRIDP